MKKYISLLLPIPLLTGCYSEALASATEQKDPTYTANAVFESGRWSSEISRHEVIETALAKTFDYLDNRRGDIDYDLVDVHIDPIIPEKHHEWIEQLGKDAMLAAPGLSSHFDVIVGMDTEFMHDVVNSKGLEMPVRVDHYGSIPCPYSYGGCKSNTSLWAGWAHQPLDNLNENKGVARNLLHEAMHAIQDDLDHRAAGQIPPRHMNDLFRPVWFVEGSAEFWSYALADYTGMRKYGHESEQIDYKPLVETEEWEGNDWQPYEWGQVALEYLVAYKGFEVYLDIYSNLDAGQHFDDAFRDAVGIELADFYSVFDQYVANNFLY